jgi:hypothetical protein
MAVDHAVLTAFGYGLRILRRMVGIPVKPNTKSGMNPNGIPG